jgi:hypothetical protein
MPHITSEFSHMRFRKSIKDDGRHFSMTTDMYRLFFALDEDKSMSQVLSQQQMDPAVMMDCIYKLWMQGLIEPVGLTNLYLDENFSKLLKINLYYIMGRKDLACACVDSALNDLGLYAPQLAANRADSLVAVVSSKIANPVIREKFRDFMQVLIPLRVKMKLAPGADGTRQIPGLARASRGKTRKIIDRIIAARSGGNPIIAKNVKTKLMLKGIDPDAYFDDTLDNPRLLETLRLLAAGLGVDLQERSFSDRSPQAPRGQIRRLILEIINQRSRGNPLIAKTIRTKLFLKGIDVDRYGPDTPDDPMVLEKVKNLALTLGIHL